MSMGSRLARRALLAAAVLLPAPALAQWRYLFPSGFSLTEADLLAQRDAARRLLHAEPPPVGRSEEWSNPRSGARGTVTLLGASELRGMPCRRVRFQVATPRAREPFDMTYTLCRVADGSWKIA
jgi:hypothetical protein